MCTQELDGSDIDGLLSNSPADTAAALIETVYLDAVAHVLKRMAVGEHATRQAAACNQTVRTSEVPEQVPINTNFSDTVAVSLCMACERVHKLPFFCSVFCAWMTQRFARALTYLQM